MHLVSTNDIKPGMILAEDVTDNSGRMLLAKGQPVADKHLTIFKMWGVAEVSVQEDGGTGPAAAPTPDTDTMRQVAEELRPVFGNNDLTHPAVAEIFRQAVMLRSRRAAGKPARTDCMPADTPAPSVTDGAARRRRLRQRDIQLPEIPTIIFRLNDIIADPFSSADDIARVISTSPGLSALLLRIVNSAFYGFPSRIDSVTRAVTIIGSKEVSALAVGISTLELFKDIPRSVFDMRAFTHHSLACGVVARILAAKGNIRNTEQMFVSGLLHDIGRLVIFRYFPREAAALLASAAAASLYDREKQVLGFRHTDIAADLMEKWKFPVPLGQNVVYHHRPTSAQDPAKAAIVHLADIIVHSLGEGKSGERQVPQLDPHAWDLLQFSPKAMGTIIPQAVHHLRFLMTIFQESGA